MVEIISESFQSQMTIETSNLNYALHLTGFVMLFVISLKQSSYMETVGSNHLSEGFIIILKLIGYGMLAVGIYVHHISLYRIEVLTFFTYLLATFETAHCIVTLFGYSIKTAFLSFINHFFLDPLKKNRKISEGPEEN